MKNILAVGLLIVGVTSFAEDVNPRARWPTLPQLRGNPRSRPSTAHVQGWERAVKEAEAKFNCVFKPSYAYGVDGKWNAGEGKSYIFDNADGTYLKFDENGRLVKAGNRGDFDEIQWTYKRACEISQELQQKMQQELQRKRETPNVTVGTTNLNERKAK